MFECGDVDHKGITCLHKEPTVRWLGADGGQGRSVNVEAASAGSTAAGSTSVGSVAEAQSFTAGDGTRTVKNECVVSECTEGK